MTLLRNCDFCGGDIAGTRFATVRSEGWYEGIRGPSINDRAFHYHAGEESDDSSCYRRAMQLLAYRREWAFENSGEVSGLEWRLCPTGQADVVETVRTELAEVRAEVKRAREELELSAGPAGPHAGLSPWEIGVPGHCCVPLDRWGIRTVRELLAKTEREVLAIPQIGPKTLAEIVEALERKGLRLRMRQRWRPDGCGRPSLVTKWSRTRYHESSRSVTT